MSTRFSSPTYSKYRAIMAEGARIGIYTCHLCGSTINYDPDDEISAIEIHDRWHFDLYQRLNSHT